MSIIQHSELEYHSVLIMVDCQVENFDLHDLAKNIRLDSKLNEERVCIINNDRIVGKAMEICSTRLKNKINGVRGYGFVKVSYPSTKEIMTYTSPTELIFVGCFCIYCNVYGPYAHLETCQRPRKTSLQLSVGGIFQSISKLRPLLKMYNDTKDIRTFKELLTIKNITIEDLHRFKYQDKYSKQSDGKVNYQLKLSILKLIDGLKEEIKQNKKSDQFKCVKDYEILDIDKIKDEAYAEIDQDYIPTSNSSSINFSTKTNISISSIVSIPAKDKMNNFPGPVMITHRNQNGEGVTIRIRSNKDKTSCTVEMISNPYSEIDLYKEVLKRIEDTGVKLSVSNTVIKTMFSSNVLFDDPTKQIDMVKLTSYLWPENDYNGGNGVSIKMTHDYVISKLSIASKDHVDNDNYRYIYFTGNEKRWSGKNTEHLFRYTVSTNFEVHKNRMCIELLPVFINSENYLVAGPDKITLQLFSHGHFQLTFSYAKEKENCAIITNFQDTDTQLTHIQRTLTTISRNFTNMLLNLDTVEKNGRVIGYQLIIKRDTLKNEYLKMFCTRNGSMPYANRKNFRIEDKVNVFKNKTMTWNTTPGIIKDIFNDRYMVFYKGREFLISHQFLRRLESSNDQVCRLKESGGSLKQPKPYSFVYPGIQNGLDKIVFPLESITGRDNLRYLQPIECTSNHKVWLINFIFNGFTNTEREEQLICRFPYKNKMIKTKYDHFCGTFKPGTTDIGSKVFVKESKLKVVEKKKNKDKASDSYSTVSNYSAYSTYSVNSAYSNYSEPTGDGIEDGDCFDDEGSDSEYGSDSEKEETVFTTLIDNYSSDPIDNGDYIKVKIFDKYKTHGHGNDNIEVIYKVKKSNTDKTYEISGRYFHPCHIENRDFSGLRSVVKYYNDIRKLSGLNKITVKDVLLQCFVEADLVSNQTEHVYSNELILINRKFINDIDNKSVVEGITDSDKLIISIPATMNYLTHSVLEINNHSVVLNGEVMYKDSCNVIINDIVKFQGLLTTTAENNDDNDTNNTIIKKHLYLIDVIYDTEKEYVGNVAKEGKNRIVNAYKRLKKNDALKYLEQCGINLILGLEEYNNEYDHNSIYTSVYIGHKYGSPRYILPEYLYKGNIVLMVAKCYGNNMVQLGIYIHEKQKYTTLGYFIYMPGVKEKQYVQVKLNILPDGILYPGKPILNYCLVTKKEYLGQEKTLELFRYLVPTKTVHDDE